MTTHTPLRCANSFMVQRGSSEVVLMDTGAYPSVSNFLNETWTWNGTDWTNTGTTLIDANGPLPGRINHVMAYDGYNVMLFGGQADSSLGGYLRDTWTWGGSSWVRKSPTTSPFGRHLAEACRSTTTALNATMFGGYGGNAKLVNETWKWDGYLQNWTQQSPATSPPARIGHCMAGGPTFLVMFGGSNSAGECKNDTWKYDGTTWTLQAPATSPSSRIGASMAYDATNNVWVLFGGMNEYYRLPETWTYNGTTWTQAAPATSPPGLTWSQMCWDSQSGRVLLFGGFSATDNYASAQTWSWNGTTWALL
jgi:hypothetical protein